MGYTIRESKDFAGTLPLLVGLSGPSDSGKTYSALRLAKGMQEIRGGNIIGIDTESRRLLHYKDEFNFTHFEFTSPFSSMAYREVITVAAERAKGGVVIIDSMSHEHEGEGGHLEQHEAEIARIAGDDHAKRERVKFLAWVKPKADRTRLLLKILQLDCAFIFCFRAKEKIKVQKGKEPIDLGWLPIAGEEFAFEMTVRCLLLPTAKGVPDWSFASINNYAAKRSHLHAHILRDGRQLDEEVGRELARWSLGKDKVQEHIKQIELCVEMPVLQDKFAKAWKECIEERERALLKSAYENTKLLIGEKNEPGVSSTPA